MTLQATFSMINQALLKHQGYWRPIPFQHKHPSWTEQSPELALFLQQLSDQDVQTYTEDLICFARDITSFIPDAMHLIKLSHSLPMLEKCCVINQHEFRFFKQGIKGRKWQQICAFVEKLAFSQLPVVEWCSGKGYLGKLYATLNDQQAVCIEKERSLINLGQQHALKHGVNATYYQHDVLKDNLSALFKANCGCLALHACGHLHVRLMQLAAENQVDHLTIAPCCYHLYGPEQPKALSQIGKSSSLQLSISDIRLALEELVTGAAAELQKHQKLQRVRLAFDEYCRHELNFTGYTATPALPQSFAKRDSEELFLHLASLKNIAINFCQNDIEYWLQQGQQRYQLYVRYNLVRYLFRRLIELWLVYDRGLFMEESGYDVELGEFCDKALSPRNIMIRATRSAQ